MPIYMDRHDIPVEITAEHVAQMHHEDLKIEHLYGCKGMTYWCDEKRRTAFCLIQAPNKKAIQDMHNHAHGDVPHKIIEVEGSIVESFLGRIEDPEKSQKTELNIINDPAFRTLMVLRLKKIGFLDSGHQDLKSIINSCSQAIIKSTEKFIGRIVQQKSDYFLISYTSVTNGVLCALEIQRLLNTILQSQGSTITLNIGLSTGIPVTDKESIFEDSIKLAERLCEIGKGQIVMSSEVKELYESESLNNSIVESLMFAINPNDEKFLTALMDFIDKEWNNPTLNASDLGKKLGYSKSQLYRKIIASTGESPNNFIKEYRLNRALELLHKQTENVSEIAFQTGFNSPAYFSKCFSDKFGTRPSKIFG